MNSEIGAFCIHRLNAALLDAHAIDNISLSSAPATRIVYRCIHAIHRNYTRRMVSFLVGVVVAVTKGGGENDR
jgi:hypothetical protein